MSVPDDGPLMVYVERPRLTSALHPKIVGYTLMGSASLTDHRVRVQARSRGSHATRTRGRVTVVNFCIQALDSDHSHQTIVQLRKNMALQSAFPSIKSIIDLGAQPYQDNIQASQSIITRFRGALADTCSEGNPKALERHTSRGQLLGKLQISSKLSYP